MKLSNWINGAPCDTPDSMGNINPRNGTEINRVPITPESEVNRAVEAADAAWTDWAKQTPKTRGAILNKIADGIQERFEEFVTAESIDTGKPEALAREVDIPRSIDNFRFFAGEIQHQSSSFHPMDGAINYTLRRPVGVAALITPWNLPLYLLTWKVAPALGMGNAVVVKPSEITPTTATLLAEVCKSAGLPDGLFNLVHGPGNPTGAALVSHPKVNAVSFTGGTETGRMVAASAAPQFKKLSLELGGKNPTIVFADADIEKAAIGAARAAFLNQGQICLCGSRILVEQSISEQFTGLLVKEAKRLKETLGSLISRDHREKVHSYVEAAIADGGDVLCGGRFFGPEQGAFYEPTVISGLDHSCKTVQEEIFGPVVTVNTFRNESEATSLANDVQFGLAASIWTKDLEKAHRVAANVESGMVWVNTWLKRDLRVPFGGLKQSGLGREGGAWSLSFYSEVRNICIAISDEVEGD